MLQMEKKFLFFVCLFILFGMCIYPPWQRLYQDKGNTKMTIAQSHSFIWDCPEDANTIDYGRLGIQTLPVILVMFLLVISTRFPLFPANKKPESTPVPRKKKWVFVKYIFLSLVFATLCIIIVFLMNESCQSENRARSWQTQYSAMLKQYGQLRDKYQALQTAEAESVSGTGKGMAQLRALDAGCSLEQAEELSNRYHLIPRVQQPNHKP